MLEVARSELLHAVLMCAAGEIRPPEYRPIGKRNFDMTRPATVQKIDTLADVRAGDKGDMLILAVLARDRAVAPASRT